MDIKVSEAWLRERVNPGLNAGQLAAQLTAAGLTVERLEPVATVFTGVVVGKIETVQPHPNAGKLSLCVVNDNSDSFKVVCGAPNVRPGANCAFAKVGANLPAGQPIQEVDIRGEHSTGMLCSMAELGLGADNEGILILPADAPVGEDLWLYLQLDDYSLHLDLTPNRADCLSVEGLAREIAAINKVPMQPLVIKPVTPTITDTFPVTLLDPVACPKYLGRIIRGLDLTVQAPIWMREKLRRCNIRSIDPIVDITNYVLRELGQPMHAFDLHALTGGIQVRQATPGEHLVLLNGRKVALRQGTLLIADDRGPLALAGVMGGQETGIQPQGERKTTDVFLECAYFSPSAIAGTARDYGLVTDAAQCYERGVDFELQTRAIEYATALLLEIAGGEAGPVVETIKESCLPKRPDIELRASRIPLLLAINPESQEVIDMFDRLGFQVTEPDGQAEDIVCRVKPPSHRFDVHYEVDLLEEVARLHGYDEIPYALPIFSTHLKVAPECVLPDRYISDTLVALGYQEAITYAFAAEDLQTKFSQGTPARLKNPVMADKSVMRMSLLPGLLSVLGYNWNRQQRRMRLFEIGNVFEHDQNAENTLRQQNKVAGLIMGERQPETWHRQAEEVDFYDLKGNLETLLGTRATEIFWQPIVHPALHPGQSAELVLEGRAIGLLGRLHPQLETQLGIRNSVFMFEIESSSCIIRSVPEMAAVGLFPSLRRDIAVTLDKNLPVADVLKRTREAAGPLLLELVLFDLYEGKNIEPDKKSLALGLTFQSPVRSLIESEVELVMGNVFEALRSDFAAVLRGE